MLLTLYLFLNLLQILQISFCKIQTQCNECCISDGFKKPSEIFQSHFFFSDEKGLLHDEGDE
jgi:hypothetical protein